MSREDGWGGVGCGEPSQMSTIRRLYRKLALCERRGQEYRNRNRSPSPVSGPSPSHILRSIIQFVRVEAESRKKHPPKERVPGLPPNPLGHLGGRTRKRKEKIKHWINPENVKLQTHIARATETERNGELLAWKTNTYIHTYVRKAQVQPT